MLKTMRSAAILAAILVTAIPLAIGCRDSQEGFAIYLTASNVPAPQMPSNLSDLRVVGLQETPYLSQNDIVEYRQATHEIVLTEEAYKKVSDFHGIPISGRTFVVTVDRKPIYWGAIWPMFSSASFDGVVIMVPPFNKDPNTIEIGTGYPGPDFSRGTDPRSDARVFDALRKAEKLK